MEKTNEIKEGDLITARDHIKHIQGFNNGPFICPKITEGFFEMPNCAPGSYYVGNVRDFDVVFPKGTFKVGQDGSFCRMNADKEAMAAHVLPTMYRRLTYFSYSQMGFVCDAMRKFTQKWEGKIQIDEMRVFQDMVTWPQQPTDAPIFHFVGVIIYRVPEDLKDEYDLK